MSENILSKLRGGDLRSIGSNKSIVAGIKTREQFTGLFNCLFNPDRVVVMRAADAIEKITLERPEFLSGHKEELLRLSQTAVNKELKWHLAQLIPRLKLTPAELQSSFKLLEKWAEAGENSRIVRANALEALHLLSENRPVYRKRLDLLIHRVWSENIPSLRARIKKLGIK
jgi:hypothetical protein